MEAFHKNLISIYGEKGKSWLTDLPKQIDYLKSIWNLSNLQPFPSLSFNYVLSGFQGDTPIVLKLCPTPEGLETEVQALDHFRHHGAVRLLQHQNHALLLQRAIPGTSLRKMLSKKDRIKIACQVIERLGSAPIPEKLHFPRIEEWLSTLDRDWDIPKQQLNKARKFKDQLLLQNMASPILLHGDLHQNNILSNEKEWLVIDPKGVIGYPINEIWACVEDPSYDLKYLADYFNYRFEEVVKWYYVHLTLLTCWQRKDGLDPNLFLNLAQSVEPML